MADTKRFGALLGAAAVCVGLSAAYAADGKNAFNITGEMQFDAVSRQGTTSFSSGQNFTSATADDTRGGGVTHADESDLTGQKVYLNFSLDMANNAKVFVQLGGRGYAGFNGDNTSNTVTANGGGDSSFNARVRQAYLEMHEVWMKQLGLKFGMQDMVMGLDRGDQNHFVMYSPSWGKHFQIRDGGRVENSFSTRRRQGAAALPNSVLGFDDINTTDGGTFAWMMTFDHEQMFSASLFYVTLENDGQGLDDGHLWGAEARIPVKMGGMGDKSLVTAHMFNVKDNSFVALPNTVAARPWNGGTDFWQYGLGADLFFQDAFEGYGEFAIQKGTFDQGVNTDTLPNISGSSADIGQEKRQNAYAYYLGAKVNVPGAAEFKPSLDVSFWEFSGDDNQNDANNSGFINYGDNKSTLVVEENEYGIGLSNNYSVWRFKASVDLAGMGFTQKKSTPLTVSYHDFEVTRDRVRGTLAANNGAGDINPGSLGREVDLTLAHEYSENVTFKLGYGVFMPGMYVRENANMSVPQVLAVSAIGTPGAGAADGANASVLVFTTSVKF